MPRSIPVVGGPAAGFFMKRPKRAEVTFPMPSGPVRYSVRRLRNRYGELHEVLAVVCEPIDAAYIEQHGLIAEQ
jgi:hypothetical protein